MTVAAEKTHIDGVRLGNLGLGGRGMASHPADGSTYETGGGEC